MSTTLTGDDVDAALRRTGTGRRADDGSVLLDVQVLHDRARADATAADWDRSWAAMLDYAGRKGWLADDGRAVRAHIQG